MAHIRSPAPEVPIQRKHVKAKTYHMGVHGASGHGGSRCKGLIGEERRWGSLDYSFGNYTNSAGQKTSVVSRKRWHDVSSSFHAPAVARCIKISSLSDALAHMQKLLLLGLGLCQDVS